MGNISCKSNYNELVKQLYTGVVCDVMDELGYRHQAMRPNVRPMNANTLSFMGPAKTILSVDVFYVDEMPYEHEIAAIDSIKENEVVVAGTNQSTNNGLWGELLSTASMKRGAKGAIIDGLIRDTKKIDQLGFPVYCTGFKPVDSRGRGKVVDYDCPVQVGDVLVHPGDIVFADEDGIAVIPAMIYDEVIEKALLKVKLENNSRAMLLEGKLLREVYDKYGVL